MQRQPLSGGKRSRLYHGQRDGGAPAGGLGGAINGLALAADGTVLAGGTDAGLRAVASDGSERWSTSPGMSVTGSPLIGPNGLVYLGTDSGGVHALYGPAPLADSPWPMFHRDRVHSGRGCLPGDSNGDGHTDVEDLLSLAASWGRFVGQDGYDMICDFDRNGAVDIVDLLILAANWGR